MEELKALQGKIKQTEMLAAKLPQAVEAREKGAAMKEDANRLQQEVLDLARRKDRLLEEKNSLMQSLPGLDDTSDLEAGRNKAVQDQRIATINLGSISAKLERIADAEGKAADLRETIKKTAKLLDDYQVLAQAFSLDGIQCGGMDAIVTQFCAEDGDAQMRKDMLRSIAMEILSLADAGGAIHDAVMIKIPRRGENNG